MIFKSVNNTCIIPVTLKIIVIFTIFILVSNFTSNYINLMFNQTEQLKLAKQLLAKDLKEMYDFSNTQFEIYNYSKNRKSCLSNISNKAIVQLKNDKAVFMGVSKDGQLEVFASKTLEEKDAAMSNSLLAEMNKSLEAGKGDGLIFSTIGGKDYFGVYKFNPKWDLFLFRGEEYKEFMRESDVIFQKVSLIILIITIICTLVGIFALRYILRFIGVITKNIMAMVKNQQLELIPLKNAPNDDITFLGMAFNSLSSTIDTLLRIFRKFANQDVAIKAYRDKEIHLEGSQKELTILFSDIKGFTFITETLGTDIIKLINMHYDRAIREIIVYDGIIGSIIGDALLAVFGTLSDISDKNKSHAAVLAGYKLHDVAESLRQLMADKRTELIRTNGKLTPDEEQVYRAVLLEIGVGIDGGQVFYGNIGSYVRMTNTVIGDNVNAASRLEGLTRVYKIPIICSDFVKDDIEKNVVNHGITFVEIDTVQVKGKTIGKKVFWPVTKEYFENSPNKSLKKDIAAFSLALEYYYDGDWKKAYPLFKNCKLGLADEFVERTKTKKCPKNWKGIWAMQTK